MNAPHLYCVQFTSGVVKIGITTCLRLRLHALRVEHGPVVLCYLGREIVTGRRAEAEALARAERLAASRTGETFTGLQFGEAATLVVQMSRRHKADASANEQSIRIARSTLRLSAGMVSLDGRYLLSSTIDKFSAQLERWALRQIREGVFA